VGDDPGDGPGPWPVAGRWTGGAPRVHDPGKIVADLAAALALGGDCLPTSRCCGTSRTWPDLELRHRRARCEDRIRNAEDTGLRNLPLKGYAQNQVWCEIVALACELLAWMRLLALTGKARRWEPKRLRLRIFAVAGRLASSGGRWRLARGRADHRHGQPTAGPSIRLTSWNRPRDTEGETTRALEPRPPGATAGQPGTVSR
jgi:hypothetical protein